MAKNVWMLNEARHKVTLVTLEHHFLHHFGRLAFPVGEHTWKGTLQPSSNCPVIPGRERGVR